MLIWDRVQSGLCVVIGKTTKTLRSNYQLHGSWRARSLGRFYEIAADNRIAWARNRCGRTSCWLPTAPTPPPKPPTRSRTSPG